MMPSARFALARTRHRARGVSLITAVFLVVVLAGLAAAIARVSLTQASTSAMDVVGVQAYHAARSGLEWGIFRQLRLGPANGDCFALRSTFALPAKPGVHQFTVTVTCDEKDDNFAGDTTNRWTLKAVACNKPNQTPGPTFGCPNASADPDYMQRTVQAELN